SSRVPMCPCRCPPRRRTISRLGSAPPNSLIVKFTDRRASTSSLGAHAEREMMRKSVWRECNATQSSVQSTVPINILREDNPQETRCPLQSRCGRLGRVDTLVGLLRRPAEALGQAAVGVAAIAPASPRARHLLQPVVQ